jgi:D-3-phosphoglycerate dehydrogenase
MRGLLSVGMKTVAFAGPRLFMKFGDLEYFRTRAAEAGLEITEAHAEGEAEFAEEVRSVHALAIIARPITAHTINSLENCELIQTLSVGYDSVDVDAATAAGIPVCNTPAYCTDEVASHAMTLLVSLARKIGLILPATRTGHWDYNFTKPIRSFRGRTLGIVGLGRVGRALVPKARGFGIRVCAYDPYLDDDLFAALGVERCYELEELLESADYVSLHTPLTTETLGMIGADELARMKPEAMIVNTARGPVWDEPAVANALNEGVIAAAATDVLVKEPPEPDHPFLALDNMIVTPHVAWYSEESFHKNMVDAMDEIVRVLGGKRPRSIVNPEILGRRKT